MTDYFPQKTLSYKTFVKNTMVAALQKVFSNHPDELLEATEVAIDYPRTQAEYPRVIIRFFERDISNAGIAHTESLKVDGETTPSSEVVVNVGSGSSGVHLTWDGLQDATRYRVWRASSPGIFDQYFETFDTEYTDTQTSVGTAGVLPEFNSAPFTNPQNPIGTAVPEGFLPQGTYRYRITALAPSKVYRFEHSFYNGDIEFAVYGLSSYDRDLIADTIVQILRMGTLEDYTNRFFAQVYTEQQTSTNVHIISFNSDYIQGFGENQAPVEWGEEDALVYTTAYRVKIWGEFYNVPPKTPYGVVRDVLLYPYIEGVEAVPTGLPNNDEPWE